MERCKLSLCKTSSNACRMNTRAEQAFVSIDIADTAEDTLIEQQGLDSRAPRTESCAKFFQGDFERLRSQAASKHGHPGFRN